jgi:indolepyruvate ferredoxin oxidoreductase
MAYKDEYEVARLHTDAAFHARLNTQFEGGFQLNFHLAPPLLAPRNAAGELQKSSYGAWLLTAFKILAPLKFLRGGPLDVFGYSPERREERSLPQEYHMAIETMLTGLHAGNRDIALAFARVPEQIRGFGHVKARHLVAARATWAQLFDQFHRLQ